MEEAPAHLSEYSLSFGKWSVLNFGSPHSSVSLFSFKLPRIFSVPWDHWFTNFNEHQSVLEVLLKHSLPGPTLRDEAWTFALLTNFQVILMLQHVGTTFWDPLLNDTAYFVAMMTFADFNCLHMARASNLCWSDCGFSVWKWAPSCEGFCPTCRV